MQLLGKNQILSVSPKAFDWVQIRVVSWQPHEPELVFKRNEGVNGWCALMVKSNTHHQNHPPSKIVLDLQVP